MTPEQIKALFERVDYCISLNKIVIDLLLKCCNNQTLTDEQKIKVETVLGKPPGDPT